VSHREIHGSTPAARPRYRDLPRNDVLGSNHAWGLYGEADELGSINLLTSDRVGAAAAEIRTGQIYNLSLPLNEPNPSWSGRQPYLHTIFAAGRNAQDDYLDGFYLQRSSQWDGLRHISAREFGYYNGTSPEAAGPGGDRLGIERWAEHGIAGRGVLADVARALEARGTRLGPGDDFAITPDILRGTLDDSGAALRDGDILLVRTGFLAGLMAASAADRDRYMRERKCPGLSAREDMAEFLWDSGVAAVVSDNPIIEVSPGSPEDGYLHRRLIPLLGMALGELFDLEALAADCAETGRPTCFFVGVPMNLPGAVGSPANALAIR
jgi:kynurenine formamidase